MLWTAGPATISLPEVAGAGRCAVGVATRRKRSKCANAATANITGVVMSSARPAWRPLRYIDADSGVIRTNSPGFPIYHQPAFVQFVHKFLLVSLETDTVSRSIVFVTSAYTVKLYCGRRKMELEPPTNSNSCLIQGGPKTRTTESQKIY